MNNTILFKNNINIYIYMNETDIIAAFMGRTFRVKRNGVFVEEFLRPLNANYEYTAEFRKFNISLLKQGQTNI